MRVKVIEKIIGLWRNVFDSGRLFSGAPVPRTPTYDLLSSLPVQAGRGADFFVLP
jgi:hypothetical protein